MSEDVFSVIVTYNFDEKIIKNIEAIVEESTWLLIIDNSTSDESIQLLEIIKNKYPQIEIIKNKVNEGLPKSYNKAIRIAQDNKAQYFVTFDQDTLINSGTIKELIRLMGVYSLDSIGPSLNKCEDGANAEISYPKFIISSCNVTRTYVFEKVQFDEDLFIDDVDLDFCLALEKNNYKFGKARNVCVAHEIGEKYRGRFGISFFAHTPFRYYYIFKNYYVLKKKYDSDYLKKLHLRLILDQFVILLFFKKKDRVAAFEFIRKGKAEGRKL